MSVFDAAALDGFRASGYAVGRGIVPRAAALAMGARVLDAVADNRAGAGWRESMRLLHDPLGEADWQAVQTPRLGAALDQLLGAGRWRAAGGFGSWPILFPGFAAAPWRPIDMAWHVEGRTWEHRLASTEIGITMIMLFSDVGPGDGGTAIALGSHRGVARILARDDRGYSQMALTGAWLAETPDFAVAEGRGEAGDVLFLHPFTVHTTSFNVGGRVRIACNCRAALAEPMRTAPAPGAALSPVEQAVAAALA